MKKFSDLTEQEQISLLKRDKKLREKLDSYVQDCEMDWLTEKLACINPYLRDWSIGFYNQNFIKVSDYDGIVDGIERSAHNFGCTPELQKCLDYCKKLRDCGSNLFEYHAKKLVGMFYEQELMQIVNYTENVCYKIYCNDIDNEHVRSYIEPLFDSFGLGDYLIDEKKGVYYKPYAICA